LILVSQDFLFGFWKALYWITFNLTMFVIPIMQEYERSGAFSVLGRIKEGIKANIYFYGMMAIPSTIFLIYAIFVLQVPMFFKLIQFKTA
jgi:hypothetical protein